MGKIIDMSIESAMDGGNVVRAPVISRKLNKNGNPVRTRNVIRNTTPPGVSNTVVRIINECDPIGFLADIVNGKAIQGFVVDGDGEVHEFFETPSLHQRIQVARFMADKVAPTVALVKHAHMHLHQGELPETKNDGDRTNLRQIASHAASRLEQSTGDQ